MTLFIYQGSYLFYYCISILWIFQSMTGSTLANSTVGSIQQHKLCTPLCAFSQLKQAQQR